MLNASSSMAIEENGTSGLSASAEASLVLKIKEIKRDKIIFWIEVRMFFCFENGIDRTLF